MSNHLHIICKANESFKISDIIRDFKKFTAKEIIKSIENDSESRREWMLYRFKYNGKYNKRIKHYKFWKDDNHAIQLDTNKMIDDRVNYIHENPVRSEIVYVADHYIYSSALNYAGEVGLIEIEKIE